MTMWWVVRRWLKMLQRFAQIEMEWKISVTDNLTDKHDDYLFHFSLITKNSHRIWCIWYIHDNDELFFSIWNFFLFTISLHGNVLVRKEKSSHNMRWSYSKLVWYFSLVRQICFNRPCQDSYKAFLKFQVWNVYNSLRKLRTTRQSYHNVIPKTNQVKILRNFYKIITNILRNANLIDTSLSVPGTLCTHSFNQSHHFIFNKNDHLLNQVWMKQGLSNCVSYPACLMHAI